MWFLPRLYFRDPWILLPFLFSAVVQGLLWWYIAVKIHPSAQPIFLHYNIIFGVDLLGEWWKIWYLPGGGLMIFFLNFILSFVWYGEDRLLARLLCAAAVLLEVLVGLGSYFIVGLNI